VLDELDWGLAGEWSVENVSQFHQKALLSLGITVKILFADSGVVSV
jgi:hypothetical protein